MDLPEYLLVHSMVPSPPCHEVELYVALVGLKTRNFPVMRLWCLLFRKFVLFFINVRSPDYLSQMTCRNYRLLDCSDRRHDKNSH